MLLFAVLCYQRRLDAARVWCIDVAPAAASIVHAAPALFLTSALTPPFSPGKPTFPCEPAKLDARWRTGCAGKVEMDP